MKFENRLRRLERQNWRFKFALTVLTVFLLIAGCGDENKNPLKFTDDSLGGVWDVSRDGQYLATCEYRKNGTGECWSEKDGSVVENFGIFTWRREGNRLHETLIESQVMDEWMVEVIDSNTFVFTYINNDGDELERSTYRRR